MTGTWLEEVQQRISHLRERVTKAPEASKADLEMMVDRIATSFKTLAVTAEEASKEAKAGDSQHLLGSLHGLRVQGEQALGALKAELRFIEKNLEAIKPDASRTEHGGPISAPHAPRFRPSGATTEEGRGMRRLKGMEERSATKAKFQVGDRVSFDGKTFGTVQDVTPAGPDGYTYDTSWDDGEESREIEKFLKKAKHEDHSGRRLAGMREAVAGGFTAVTLYIDGERVQIGDPDYIKMTDDIEGAVEDLKQKYRGAKVTVTPAGEREVMIEVERKKGGRLSERSTSTGKDLTHDIWREIGRWLEDEEEFELGDINEPIEPGGRGERAVLADNIHTIVERELNKRVGSGASKGVSIEIDPSGFDNSFEDGQYRAGGHFRIWHDQDSAAQGSFGAEGMAGELQNMTINITQASGHQKKNSPIKFFG